MKLLVNKILEMVANEIYLVNTYGLTEARKEVLIALTEALKQAIIAER